MRASECLCMTFPWGRRWVLTASLPPMVLTSPLIACGYLHTYPSPCESVLVQSKQTVWRKVPDKGSLSTTSKGLSEKGRLFRPCKNCFCTQVGFLTPFAWPLQRLQSCRTTNTQGARGGQEEGEGIRRVHWQIRELTSWVHPSQASFWVSWGNFAQLNESSKQSCGAE